METSAPLLSQAHERSHWHQLFWQHAWKCLLPYGSWLPSSQRKLVIITLFHLCSPTLWFLLTIMDFPRRVRLEVNNEMERRDITNVFGILEGKEEPGVIPLMMWSMSCWCVSGDHLSFLFCRSLHHSWLPLWCLDLWICGPKQWYCSPYGDC